MDLAAQREGLSQLESGNTRFEDLCRAYQRQMLTVAERILKNRQDAEDAVQDALFRISRLRVSLPQNEAVLRAYVLTAAKNAALDLLEKRRPSAELHEESAACDEDLFERIAASQDYDRLLAAIRALPGKYSEALMLRYVHGLSVRQIAALLCLTQSAVRKRLARGKALLLNHYQKEDAI